MSSPIIFKDRQEAGEELASLLQEFKNTDAVVLAIPRGGVVVAKEISTALNLPLDLIVTRKIGAPENDEYAIGAIDMNGDGVWNEFEYPRIDKNWLAAKVESEKKEAKRRWETYRKGRGPLDLKNKTVIIVDDGIATGLTMQATIAYAKHEGAQKIIVAVPVAASDSLRTIENLAQVCTIEVPTFFGAVGEWYDYFPQVSDREVLDILSQSIPSSALGSSTPK